MHIVSASNVRPFVIYLLIIIFACLPIWAVGDFINQDGSPHLYNAYIIIELLRDNPAFAEFYALNPAPIPNLSGHYLLAILLFIFSPPVVTKIMVTLTFAGLIAAVGWLRFQIVGREGLTTAFLIGAVLAFNWMWFLGFYNFIIGVIGFAFTLGLYWRWRQILNLPRSLILSALIVIIFFSHLISFVMLVGSILVVAVSLPTLNLKRALIWTGAAILPVFPFLIGYKLTSAAGGETIPVWRNLEDPLSPASWVFRLQTADPFQLLTRKGFPFSIGDSNLFAFFSPFLWLAIALLCLATVTFFYYRQKKILNRQSLPFVFLTIASILFWVFAPDDFGKSHGSFLRERVLLCGLICFVPLFRTVKFPRLERMISVLLIFVILFQTLALWEYALKANALGKEYLAARSVIGDDDRIGSVRFIENGCRFKSNPLSNINVLYGVGKRSLVWDNYEIGFYLFPVTVKNFHDRQFSFDFHESSSFELCDPNEKTADKLNQLNSLMNLHHDRIDVILIWNGEGREMPFLNRWYDNVPFYQQGRVRLFRHRQF